MPDNHELVLVLGGAEIIFTRTPKYFHQNISGMSSNNVINNVINNDNT